MKFSFIAVLWFISACCLAQESKPKKLRYQKKTFAFSLTPGVSTNGIYEGWYFNKFSFNLFSGLSAGSQYFEIAGISNLSTQHSTGIQIAGLTNVIGANSFLNLTIREERDRIVKEGFSSDLEGFQIAGFMNYVRNNVTGLQFTGGFNLSNGSLLGVQIGGLGGLVNHNMTGLQLSGLFNVAIRSVDGVQISSLANISNGTLFGLQLAMFNHNRAMAGKRMDPPMRVKSFQIGLVNKSGTMAGTQIGLLNIAKKNRGTQIGLINIYKTGAPKDIYRTGTPIGLLNFGNRGAFLSITADELFLFNLSKTTGNCRNCSDTESGMPFSDKFQQFNQNHLMVSYNVGDSLISKPKLAVGYGFERLYYKKRTMTASPRNGDYLWSWKASVQQLFKEMNWSDEMNLLSRIGLSYGKRFNSQIISGYLKAGIHLSLLQTANGENWIDPPLKFWESQNRNSKIWPGYSIGLQL